MSNSPQLQQREVARRQRTFRVVKAADRPVAANDYEYQQQRAVKSLVRNYVRQHPQEIIDMLGEDGAL